MIIITKMYMQKWPLWAGDHYSKVTVTTGLTVFFGVFSHILAYIQICFILFYYFFLVCIYFNLFFIFVFIKESKCFCFDVNANRDTSCAATPCGFNNELLCASDESNFATVYYRSKTGKIGIIWYTSPSFIRSLPPKATPLMMPLPPKATPLIMPLPPKATPFIRPLPPKATPFIMPLPPKATPLIRTLPPKDIHFIRSDFRCT